MKNGTKPYDAEIKILKRLRRMLMRRHESIEDRFEVADRTQNIFRASELQAEQSGISWSIHDLDYIVGDLRGKQKQPNGGALPRRRYNQPRKTTHK